MAERDCDEFHPDLERREEAQRADYFESAYPSVLAAVKRVLSQEAGGPLYTREDVFEDLIERLCEDLFQFGFRDALALAGREPFNPWRAA